MGSSFSAGQPPRTLRAVLSLALPDGEHRRPQLALSLQDGTVGCRWFGGLGDYLSVWKMALVAGTSPGSSSIAGDTPYVNPQPGFFSASTASWRPGTFCRRPRPQGRRI